MLTYTCKECEVKYEGEPYLLNGEPLCPKCYWRKRFAKYKRDAIKLLIFTPAIAYFIMVAAYGTGGMSLCEVLLGYPIVWLCIKASDWYTQRY